MVPYYAETRTASFGDAITANKSVSMYGFGEATKSGITANMIHQGTCVHQILWVILAKLSVFGKDKGWTVEQIDEDFVCVLSQFMDDALLPPQYVVNCILKLECPELATEQVTTRCLCLSLTLSARITKRKHRFDMPLDYQLNKFMLQYRTTQKDIKKRSGRKRKCTLDGGWEPEPPRKRMKRENGDAVDSSMARQSGREDASGDEEEEDLANCLWDMLSIKAVDKSGSADKLDDEGDGVVSEMDSDEEVEWNLNARFNNMRFSSAMAPQKDMESKPETDKVDADEDEEHAEWRSQLELSGAVGDADSVKDAADESERKDVDLAESLSGLCISPVLWYHNAPSLLYENPRIVIYDRRLLRRVCAVDMAKQDWGMEYDTLYDQYIQPGDRLKEKCHLRSGKTVQERLKGMATTNP